MAPGELPKGIRKSSRPSPPLPERLPARPAARRSIIYPCRLFIMMATLWWNMNTLRMQSDTSKKNWENHFSEPLISALANSLLQNPSSLLLTVIVMGVPMPECIPLPCFINGCCLRAEIRYKELTRLLGRFYLGQLFIKFNGVLKNQI